MFPDPSGVTTPLTLIASKPQDDEEEDEDLHGGVDRGTAPSSSPADGASVKSPEPHWDSVIGAATD